MSALDLFATAASATLRLLGAVLAVFVVFVLSLALVPVALVLDAVCRALGVDDDDIARGAP